MTNLTFDLVAGAFGLVCLILYIMRRNARRKRMLE